MALREIPEAQIMIPQASLGARLFGHSCGICASCDWPRHDYIDEIALEAISATLRAFESWDEENWSKDYD